MNASSTLTMLKTSTTRSSEETTSSTTLDSPTSPKDGETTTSSTLASTPLSNLWFGTRGPRYAKIMVVGEAWGQQELQRQQPFVGASGKLLNEMLTEAGLDPHQIFFTNLIAAKPSANDFRQFLIQNERGEMGLLGDGIRPTQQLTAELMRLDRQIEEIKPKIIIAAGNWPLWYLTHKANIGRPEGGYKMPSGITYWRGSQIYLAPSPFRALEGIPVLPIIHPAGTLRDYKYRPITVQDFRRVRSFFANGLKWEDPKQHINVPMPTAEWLESFIDDLLKNPSAPTICDLETKKGLIHITGLSRAGINVSIPFFHITAEGFKSTYDRDSWPRIYMALFRFFNHPDINLVGQNFSYDLQYITKYFHCTPRCSFDTMVAQHVAFVALPKGLDFLSSMYCEHHVYWKDDLKESTDTYNTEQACLYNCEDLWRTEEVAEVLAQVVKAKGLQEQFDCRMELMDVLTEMMNKGVAVNDKLRQEQKKELLVLSNQIAEWLESVMPDNIKPVTKSKVPWYDSTQQLMYILYDRIGLREMTKRAKKGEPPRRTADKEALVELGEYYPQFKGLFSAIIILRSIGVVAGNILSAPLDIDRRMRTNFKVTGTETYRLASSENVWGGGGNLQNVLRERDAMDLLEQDLI